MLITDPPTFNLFSVFFFRDGLRHVPGLLHDRYASGFRSCVLVLLPNGFHNRILWRYPVPQPRLVGRCFLRVGHVGCVGFLSVPPCSPAPHSLCFSSTAQRPLLHHHHAQHHHGYHAGLLYDGRSVCQVRCLPVAPFSQMACVPASRCEHPPTASCISAGLPPRCPRPRPSASRPTPSCSSMSTTMGCGCSHSAWRIFANTACCNPQ